MEDLGAAAKRLLAKLDERTRQNKQRVDLFGNTCSHLPSTTRKAMDEGRRGKIALVGEPQPRSMAEIRENTNARLSLALREADRDTLHGLLPAANHERGHDN